MAEHISPTEATASAALQEDLHLCLPLWVEPIASGHSLHTCAHDMSLRPVQVEVTNVFRPIAEAETSKRLIPPMITGYHDNSSTDISSTMTFIAEIEAGVTKRVLYQ